mgnify:CR=1 FL=1
MALIEVHEENMPFVDAFCAVSGFSSKYAFVKVIIFLVVLATGIARKRSVCPAGQERKARNGSRYC